MSKLLTTLIAVVFAAATSGAVAQTPAPAKGDTTKAAPKGDKAKGETKAESKKKAETADEKKAARAAVAKACKGKQPGEEVTVDGKKVKCPAPKKAAQKAEPKREMKKGEGTKAEGKAMKKGQEEKKAVPVEKK